MKRLVAGLLIAGCAAAGPVAAYELRTHSFMTYQAYLKSRLNTDASIAATMGLDMSDFAPLSTYYFDMQDAEALRRDADSFSQVRMPEIVDTSIAGWLNRGAIREDDLNIFGCAGNALVGWCVANQSVVANSDLSLSLS